MTTIPNELIITINTSIPGYQKITYRPSMTIPNISHTDNKILFDPLVKLNKKKLDEIPENFRKKQFFNKGLFESLLRYNKSSALNNLTSATRNGYVDNNIKIVLDILFAENTVIYIGKAPYTISDVQWTKGNWKIDVKENKEQYQSRYFSRNGFNPIPYFPTTIIYGNNYSGPVTITSSPSTQKEEPVSETKFKNNTPIPIQPVTTLVNNSKTEDQISQPVTIINTQQPQTDIPKPPQKPPKLLPGVKPNPDVPIPNPLQEQVIEPLEKYSNSPQSTRLLKEYFLTDDFFDLIYNIYKFSDKKSKDIINQSLKPLTVKPISIDSLNLNKIAYEEAIKSINVVKNTGGGDCFFIAVADAINNYNFYNQDNRIISGIYGTGKNLFTQKYLREIVASFFLNSPNVQETLQITGQVNADILNEKFEKELNAIKSNISTSTDYIVPSKIYVSVANATYKNNDNFLVKNIVSVPKEKENYYKPFKPIKLEEVKDYIESNNYWANEMAVNALSKILQLNIIPLENSKGILRVPFANFSQEKNDWTKYLFLYYSNSHFELINFEYKNITKQKIQSKTVEIFDKNKLYELPPFFILFVIYGSYYSSLTDKSDFGFYQEIMKSIDNTIDNLYKLDIYRQFFELFKKYFPSSKIQKPTIVGGYTDKFGYNYVNPYYHEPPHKKDDLDKLAYYITIDMELYPGKSIPPEEIAHLKCNNKWNAVRKAYSEFMGKPYEIQPVYKERKTKKNNHNSANRTRRK